MRIAINITAAHKPIRTGVGEYVHQLTKHLPRLGESREHDFLFYKSGRRRFWNQIILPRLLLRDQPDVLFSPSQPPPVLAGLPIVWTLHGLEPEEYPAGYSLFYRKYFRWSNLYALRKSLGVIVPSEMTKNRLERYYRYSPENVRVIHHGAPDVGSPTSYINVGSPTSYILFLGRKDKRKNIAGIIKAFWILRKRRFSQAKLALVGPPGNALLSKSGFDSNIVIQGFVSDEEKERWYRKASVFLFPSFAEGFGLPILEAQAYGVPVITSFSLREVAGEGALFVDPRSPTDIAKALAEVLSSQATREKIIEKGYENVRRFSWEKCARETLGFLLTVAQK